MTPVRFRNWTCRVEQGRYSNGRTALQLVDAIDGEPIAKATINLPDEPCGPDECFIKSYAENGPQGGQPGMLEALEQAGVVQRTGEWVKSGFVQVPKCRIVGRA